MLFLSHSVNRLEGGEVLLLSNPLITIFLPSFCNDYFSGTVEKSTSRVEFAPPIKIMFVNIKKNVKFVLQLNLSV